MQFEHCVVNFPRIQQIYKSTGQGLKDARQDWRRNGQDTVEVVMRNEDLYKMLQGFNLLRNWQGFVPEFFI